MQKCSDVCKACNLQINSRIFAGAFSFCFAFQFPAGPKIKPAMPKLQYVWLLRLFKSSIRHGSNTWTPHILVRLEKVHKAGKKEFFWKNTLKVHLHEICLFSFLHLSNTYRPNNKASDFLILFLNLLTYLNFLTFDSDSVDAESHSSSTESMPTETPRQLSQRGVRLHVNWDNAEW